MPRRDAKQQRLDELESDFRTFLVAFRLGDAASEIQTLRAEFGSANPLAGRFLHYRSLRGANVLGEPKLARQFLEEIRRGDF